MKISINAVLPHCTLCFFSILFTFSVGIGTYFVYIHWFKKNKAIVDLKETTIQ